MHLPSMPPYHIWTSPYRRRVLTTVRQPWIWFPLLFGCAVVLHLQVARIFKSRHHDGCRPEPVRTTLDNFQYL